MRSPWPRAKAPSSSGRAEAPSGSTWELTGLKDGSAVTLKVEGQLSELRLWMNEKQLPSQRVTEGMQGKPGVFAMGLGCFEFDDLSVQLPSEG